MRENYISTSIEKQNAILENLETTNSNVEIQDNNVKKIVEDKNPLQQNTEENTKINSIENKSAESPNTKLEIIVNNPSVLFTTGSIEPVKGLNKSFLGSNKPIEIDNEQIRKIGEAGESFILQYEIERLRKMGKNHLISKIKHIPAIYGNVNDFGCDILSFNENEEEIKIEVKTTVSGKNTMFYLTDNEYTHLTNESNYFIYRVYNFDLEKQIGDIIIIENKEELDKYFKTTEAKYVAKPRR